ncbi:Acetylornithine deacetylase [hydrothermal vent metagenome]|uniref:Acetylornithine deacetylase n=1 Tax=hydrothermal vent metagenome TaxID=652676 RepID=A0A3B0ZE41_9ZZZZ
MHNTPDLLDMIDGLISAPSVSSVNAAFDQGNQLVIERLAGWLEPLGYHVEIMPLPDQPGKANLIATLGSGPGGLVLAGHTDTVPWDEGRWNFDPFRLTRQDDRLYGLGTSDMKAFLALAIEAASSFDASQFREPLILVATADEESSMAGARALVDAKRPQARYAVIGEPTGLRPVRLHKGILMEAIHLRGQSGHSSDPSLGNNALEGMHAIISELLRWRAELQAEHRNPLFEVPVPTLNLGHIHGGDNPNRICADCELHIDLRPLPGMEIEALRHTLQTRLSRVVEGSGLELDCHPLFEGTPALETDAASDIVRVTEKLTGYSAAAVAFGTEAPYFKRMGIDTVVLGPGDIDQAHQPDEYLACERIDPTINLLRQLIHRFCITAAE